jgi:hypothetical protein
MTQREGEKTTSLSPLQDLLATAPSVILSAAKDLREAIFLAVLGSSPSECPASHRERPFRAIRVTFLARG